MSQIKIKDQEIQLQQPQSYAIRWDVATAGPRSPMRAMAAAIGVCWPPVNAIWPGASGRRCPLYEASGYDALRYGGTIIDDLTAAGVPMSEIVKAGAVALSLVQNGLFGEREVAAAEDFSATGERATR
jgi:hypothetical protein